MGADFTLAAIPRCELTEQREKELISLAERNQYFQEHCEDYDEDPKELILRLIEDYRNFEGSRETTVLFINNMEWFVTGGMSWGDPPTGAFDPMCVLEDNFSDIFEKWAKERG